MEADEKFTESLDAMDDYEKEEAKKVRRTA